MTRVFHGPADTFSEDTRWSPWTWLARSGAWSCATNTPSAPRKLQTLSAVRWEAGNLD